VSTLTEVHLCNIVSVTDAAVGRLLTANGGLTHLSLYGCGKVTDSAISRIGRDCGMALTELSLRGTKVTASALEWLPPSLTSLNVASCRALDGSAALMHIANRCPRLTRLNMHGTVVTDEAVAALARGIVWGPTAHAPVPSPLLSVCSFVRVLT
jgi:hypothetical protein